MARASYEVRVFFALAVTILPAVTVPGSFGIRVNDVMGAGRGFE